MPEFKQRLKELLKPQQARHYSYGSRLGNKLLTRLRLGRTFFNSHGFAIGKTTSLATMSMIMSLQNIIC